MNNLIYSLQQYGLSDKQAKVYLASLELGAAPASSIARRCTENRWTVYSILKELQKEWIVQELKRNEVSYFSVISPEVLIKNMDEKQEALKKNLPEFMALASKFGNKPKITYYEGVAGIKSQYADLLEYDTPLFSFLSDDDAAPELKKFLNTEFVKKRQARWIHASVIVSNHEVNKEYLNAVKKDKSTKVKMMKSNFEGMKGEIILYGENKVAFVLYSPTELSGYTIESDQMYSSLKSIFMGLWSAL